MPAEENTDTTADNVGEHDTDELPAVQAENADGGAQQVVGTPLAEAPVHHRIGGQPGVRVQQSALPQQKKVTGPDSPIGDHKLVPCGVLAEVRQTLDEETAAQLTAAERLRAVRDLLAPWL